MPVRPPPAILFPSDVEQLLRDKLIWEWVSGITEAPEEDTFTASDATAYASGWLKDRTYLTDVLAYFVGFSYVDQSDPLLLLNRNLPAWHPRWPWLYVSRVQVKGTKSQGQDEDANGGEGLPLPLYDRYRFRIYADGLPYEVLSDDDVDFYGTGEWGRFLTIDSEDASELFIQEGGNYKYVNTTGVGPKNGTPLIGAGLRVYAERTNLIVVSYQVAHDLILNEFGIPRKFKIAKAKVNSTTFLGEAPGTMILKSWKIKKTPQPVATQAQNTLLYGLNITMTFGFTDPPRADPAETHRGWLLAPGFDAAHNAGWYYVETDDAFHKPLYDGVDFNQLLTHQSFTTGGF